MQVPCCICNEYTTFGYIGIVGGLTMVTAGISGGCVIIDESEDAVALGKRFCWEFRDYCSTASMADRTVLPVTSGNDLSIALSILGLLVLCCGAGLHRIGRLQQG